MKLWIIYSHKEENVLVSPEMMSEEAKKHGMPNEVYYIEKFKIKETARGKKLYYKNRVVRELPKVILFRGYKPELTEYFTQQDVIIINNQNCQLACKDKYTAHRALNKYAYQPTTVLVREKTSFAYLRRRLGLPFVLKDNFGEDGEAVFLVDKEADFKRLCEEHSNLTMIAQEYIEVSKGIDIRAYVIGRKVYAIKRTNLDGGFQTNLSGGTIKAEKLRLTRKQKRVTLKIAERIGLEVGSVDFLLDGKEFVFMEANTNAGFLSFLKKGVNIKGKIFKYIKKTYREELSEKAVAEEYVPQYARAAS